MGTNEHLQETIGRIRQTLEEASGRILDSGSPEEDIAIQSEVSGRVVQESLAFLGRVAFDASFTEDEHEAGELSTLPSDENENDDLSAVKTAEAEDLGVSVNPEETDEFELDLDEIESMLGDQEPILVLPNLMGRLDRISSVHQHRYGETETVYDVLYALRGLRDDELTEQQRALRSDVEILDEFSPNGRMYQHVYTPQEIRILADSLSVLRQKNRPDFDGVEADILDVNMGRRSYVGNDRQLAGLIQRATDASDDRRGMQWTTLRNQASIASDRLSDSLGASAARKEYKIKIVDPDAAEGAKDNLTPVYQFVVDHFAYNVLAQRSIKHSRLNQATFVANCTVIRDYIAEVAGMLDAIPQGTRMKIPFGRKGQVRQLHPKAHIESLVQSMETRLESGDKGSGIAKGYKLDATAALRLQYRIAHFVDDINAFLSGENDGSVTIIEDQDLQVGLPQLS